MSKLLIEIRLRDNPDEINNPWTPSMHNEEWAQRGCLLDTCCKIRQFVKEKNAGQPYLEYRVRKLA